ncbi:MAG: isovaleryl-CoA dehydrogenase [Deltaproteobacteria bacterium]|nr:isovaleryl-CoA dehydrogenase [Deltaproteobacteria bacterium]
MELDLFTPSEVHAMVREQVSRFARERLEPRAARADEEERFDDELMRAMGSELGMFGVTVPEDEGGAGLDMTATVIVLEELSRVDPGFGLSYLAHELLFVHNFHSNGSKEQKERYLPRVISGEWLAGMAMTDPVSGSDVLAMKCTARRDGDGGYVLDGAKQFITNAGPGRLFLTYARTGEGRRDISALLVESDYPGFSVGRKESKLGMRSSPTCELAFEEVRVPLANLLGEENQGLFGMMRNLEAERIGLAAQSVGIALRCVDEMVPYALERRSFGKPLIEHGQMQRLIAESYAHTMAARTLLYQAAAHVGSGQRNRLLADAAKLTAARVGEEVARNAIQVLGGYGYCREYPVERLLRDAILLAIGGGTNEMMQKNICNELKRVYSL